MSLPAACNMSIFVRRKAQSDLYVAHLVSLLTKPSDIDIKGSLIKIYKSLDEREQHVGR